MLTYHYSRSGNREKTYHYLELSGQKASDNYSNREAFRFYTDAIELLRLLPESEENLKRLISTKLYITTMKNMKKFIRIDMNLNLDTFGKESLK